MKKKRITYGVNGMMEYQAVIKVGKKNVGILFSDGSVSAMGTNPATFTTDNLIVQHAIENSADYKRGRIRVVNTIELDEELRVERPKFPLTVAQQDSTPNAQEDENTPVTTVPDETCNPPVSTEDMDIAIPNDTAASSNEEHPAETSNENEELPEADKPDMTQVEFTCNDDAKDYLEQTFGYVRSKLRKREDIVNAGKSKGIDIIFV